MVRDDEVVSDLLLTDVNKWSISSITMMELYGKSDISEESVSLPPIPDKEANATFKFNSFYLFKKKY